MINYHECIAFSLISIKLSKMKLTPNSRRFIDADADVCYSSNPYRRYDWIKYENGRNLGDTSVTCAEKQKVDSWWRWFVHCSYCMCLCDDPSSETSDRYVSLLASITDLNDSMVRRGLASFELDVCRIHVLKLSVHLLPLVEFKNMHAVRFFSYVQGAVLHQFSYVLKSCFTSFYKIG